MRASFGRLLLLMPLLSLLAVSGCILNPDEGKDEQPPSVYKPLTDKDNVIFNLIQSYKDCNIDEYSKLLLNPGYIWYNQAEDVQNGKDPFYTRDQDIAFQRNMFAAKLGTYPDPNKAIEALNLTIENASWQLVTEIGGEPCEECWETTRPYSLELRISQGPTTYLGDDLIHFVVMAVQANGRKEWRILRADDINDPQNP